MAALNPVNAFGRVDRADGHWAGWVYAVDADTGVWKWRLKSNYPVVSGMTPTAGGVAFFGDVGGNFYALDAATGDKLWGQKLDGAIGGGVITYTAQDGKQKVAAAIGFTSIMWPTHITTGEGRRAGRGRRQRTELCIDPVPAPPLCGGVSARPAIASRPEMRSARSNPEQPTPEAAMMQPAA